MTVATLALPQLRIKAPELRGAVYDLGGNRDAECCVEGRAGTGKTVGICFKIHTMLLKYPGSKWLMARKYNTDLTGSAVATYKAILHPSHGVVPFGGSKFEPPSFRYPNGSALVIAGLDKPEKVQSKEYEGAFINEATECDLEDIEFVGMRLRPRLDSPDVPYRQLIMDCNPSYPTHWLNERMNAGATTRMISHWEDNPRFFNRITQDWTEAGHEYIGKLDKLTGVRRSRFFSGLWAAAEGTVYEDSWDRSKNVIARFPIPLSWPRYLFVDFGFQNPFVCQWVARDDDGRLIVYREIYMSHRLVEDHAKQIRAISRWGQDNGDPLPREVICDHDAEGRATLERYLGLMTMPATKNVSAGIQAMAARLRPAGDGRPRLLYCADGLVERDPELVSRKKPTCTIEEFDSYIWDTSNGAKQGDKPVKEDDHGLDTSRYACARFDLRPTDVRYSQRVY
jgi:PBSX family phage terminase large subunit